MWISNFTNEFAFKRLMWWLAFTRKAIKLLKDKYDGQVLSIFDEAVSLIPKDPFFTSTSSSSTLTSITTSGGVFLPETGTIIKYGDEQKEASKQTNIEDASSLLIEGINNLKRLCF
jgi:hypothetical protein